MSVRLAVHQSTMGRRLTSTQPEEAELLAAITSRSPTIYFPLNGTGAAAGTDQGSAGLTLVENGTIGKGASGWELASGAYLQVAHNTVFETDDGTIDVWVDSEVCVVFEAMIPSLASKVSLASKNNGSRFSNGWWLDVNANGSITWANANVRQEVEVAAQAGTITAGVYHHYALLFGRRGVQLFIDANSSDDGWSNPLNWYGWDHRLRGNNSSVLGARWVNDHPLRLGHNSFDANGSVTVKHWATFVSGGENSNPRTRTGTRLAQSDINAISGKSPTTALKGPHHTGTVTNVSTAQNLLTIINAASPGDTLVLAAGTHTLSGNPTSLDGLHIKGAGKTTTVIDVADGVVFGDDNSTWTAVTDNATNLSAGATSWTLAGHPFVSGDILLIVSTVLHETDVFQGATLEISDAMRRSQMVEVRSVSGSTINFRQALLHDFPASQRSSVWRLRPGASHVWFSDLTISTTGTGTGWFKGHYMAGCVDVRYRNVRVEQTSNVNIYRSAVLDSVVGLSAIDTTVFNNATDTGTVQHGYPWQILSGGYQVVIDCGITGSHERLDRNFNNSGIEIGNLAGPAQLVANHCVDTVDCSFAAAEGGAETVGLDQLDIGGHECVERRDICPFVHRGAGICRGNLGSEVSGVSAGQYFFRFGGAGRYHYTLGFTSRNAARNQIWQSSGDEGVRDAYFKSVVHNGNGSAVANINGTFVRCSFVSCTAPTP